MNKCYSGFFMSDKAIKEARLLCCWMKHYQTTLFELLYNKWIEDINIDSIQSLI